MRANKKAAAAGKKATKAFYPELLDEDELRPLQKAAAVSERERIEQEAEEKALEDRNMAHFHDALKNLT